MKVRIHESCDLNHKLAGRFVTNVEYQPDRPNAVRLTVDFHEPITQAIMTRLLAIIGTVVQDSDRGDHPYCYAEVETATKEQP